MCIHMNTKQGIAMQGIVGVVAIVVLVLAGGLYIFNIPRDAEVVMTEKQSSAQDAQSVEGVNDTMEEKKNDAMMENKEKAAIEKEGDVTVEQGTVYAGTVLAGVSTPLLDFQKADYDKAIQSGRLVVLYFYANWCPTCKAEFPLMQSAFNELTTDQVIGFRVNYKDNETDKDEEALARQFGVAYQHTKVFVRSGERVLKAPDSWDKARYTSEINKAISL